MELEKYSCLVVDDEPIARKIILHYMERLPFLVLAAEHINALNAIDYLKTHKGVSILFLDINMPNLSGFQLMKILQPQQPVVFTTAHTEYAVESYELNAVDYLLKPFSFERFAKAAYKAVGVIKNSRHNPYGTAGEDRLPLFIKSDGKSHPVLLEDILYCEAQKNYTLVVLSNGQKLMPLTPISKFELLLLEAGGDFIQTHRSYLVSKRHVTAVAPTTVTLKNVEIPIGVQFKERFFRSMGMKDRK